MGMGQQISGDKNIADKFNEYFTQIGPSLANSIDIANKATFDTYLKKPNSSSFQFQYTDAPSVQKIINSGLPVKYHYKSIVMHWCISKPTKIG